MLVHIQRLLKYKRRVRIRHLYLDICNLKWCFQRYSVFFIVDSRHLYKFYPCNMATTLSKPPRSGLSNFFHDLVTVDFHQTDINTGMRIAAILVIITVVGLITGHAAESGLVTIGALCVLILDQLPHKGTRTRFLLTVSILYASIFAIGMVVSISGNLVLPLCGLGLFIIAYFTVYPKTFGTIIYCQLNVCHCN